jgi:hypothetical protein
MADDAFKDCVVAVYIHNLVSVLEAAAPPVPPSGVTVR